MHDYEDESVILYWHHPVVALFMVNLNNTNTKVVQLCGLTFI
jgi:hypothetical protein